MFEPSWLHSAAAALQPALLPSTCPHTLTPPTHTLARAGFLFFKGVTAANEAAEMQDRIDGYIK